MTESASATPGSRRPLRRVAVVLVCGLVLVGLLGWLALELIADADLATARARLRAGPAVLAVLAWLVASLLAGPRLAGLLPPELRAKAPSGLVLGSWMVAVHALNLALPGPAGDVAFVGVLVRRHDLPTATVVAATTWARVWGLATVALAGLLLLPLAPTEGPLATAVAVAVGLVGIAGVALGIGTLRPRRLAALSTATLGRLAETLPGPLGAPFAGIHRGLEALANGFGAVGEGGLGMVLRTVGWSVLIQLALAASLWSAAAAVGVDLPPPVLALAHVTGELASVAVAVAPAGIGGFDASLAAALVAFGGVAAVDATLVVLAVRMVQIVALGAGTVAVSVLSPGLFSGPAAENGE